jgi:hypothetical protein
MSCIGGTQGRKGVPQLVIQELGEGSLQGKDILCKEDQRTMGWRKGKSGDSKKDKDYLTPGFIYSGCMQILSD